MRDARKSEVWMVDMGMAAKVRPCLLLTDFPDDDELALITVLPHTTALRGNKWELSIPKSFLKHGAFHLQQIQSVSVARLERKTWSAKHPRVGDHSETACGIFIPQVWRLS